MKKTALSLLLFLLPLAGLLAQDVYINPSDPAFRQRYKSLDFDGKFSVLAVSDATNNYFIVDFSQLPGKFEKVYFMYLVFKGDKVVNIDPDLSQNRVWFLAPRTTKDQVVYDYFLDMKKKTENASKSYSDAEKQEWLKKNDKYK